MDTVADARFEVVDLTPRIGSEIRTDASTLVSGSHASRIREILAERGVICFPRVNLTDEQQVAFARTIGSISDDSPSGITKISTNPQINPRPMLADYQRSSFYWHFDGFGRSVPFLATMLSARAISDTGGQTEFANTYAAFDDLPDEEKVFLEGLWAVHSLEALMRIAVPWPTYEELQRWQATGTKIQPLVWKHQSGRKSLVIGGNASHIVDRLTLPEGRALLCRLNEWATQPCYVYRHEWQVGDLVIWDNTGTLHHAIPYPTDSQRLMDRTTLTGEEPLSPGADSAGYSRPRN